MGSSFQNPSCPPDTTLHSRQLSFGPNIQFIHILKVALGGAVPDFLVQLPPLPPDKQFDDWTITFVSCATAHVNDSLFMHFKPLNKTYPGGNAVTMDGTEEWFSFNSWLASGGPLGLKEPGNSWTFRGPMPPQLYFDIGQEAGGVNYSITLAIGPGLGRFFGRT
jgi:hypothetical protein